MSSLVVVGGYAFRLSRGLGSLRGMKGRAPLSWITTGRGVRNWNSGFQARLSCFRGTPHALPQDCHKSRHRRTDPSTTKTNGETPVRGTTKGDREMISVSSIRSINMAIHLHSGIVIARSALTIRVHFPCIKAASVLTPPCPRLSCVFGRVSFTSGWSGSSAHSTPSRASVQAIRGRYPS